MLSFAGAHSYIINTPPCHLHESWQQREFRFFCGTEGMIHTARPSFANDVYYLNMRVLFLLLAISFRFFFHIIIFVLCVADIQWSTALLFDGWLCIPRGFIFFSSECEYTHFWASCFIFGLESLYHQESGISYWYGIDDCTICISLLDK